MTIFFETQLIGKRLKFIFKINLSLYIIYLCTFVFIKYTLNINIFLFYLFIILYSYLRIKICNQFKIMDTLFITLNKRNSLKVDTKEINVQTLIIFIYLFIKYTWNINLFLFYLFINIHIYLYEYLSNMMYYFAHSSKTSRW